MQKNKIKKELNYKNKGSNMKLYILNNNFYNNFI